MLITSIELVGNKRFELNNITRLLLRPDSRFHLILGSNGCGKSSLMHELTPLPAPACDYHKHGSKVIEIEHNNYKYKLTSKFDPQEHYFEKDGVNLNTGRTLTVQRELVKQEFCIDNGIQELLTGALKFHQMGPAERRLWFTRLSNTNYTYAISVYNKLKDAYRGTAESIKQLRGRIVQETNKLITPEQEQEIRTRITELRNLINELILLKPTIQGFKTDIERSIQSELSIISTNSKNYIEFRKKFLNKENYKDIEDVNNAMINAIAKKTSLSYNITNISEELMKLQETFATMRNTSVVSSDELIRQISDIEEQVNMLSKAPSLGINVEHPEYCLRNLLEISPNLVDVVLQLEVNDGKYNRDNYNSLVEKIQTTTAVIKNNDHKLARLEADKKHLEHLKTEDKTICPNCNHSWIKGYDELVYNGILNNIKLINQDTFLKTDELKTLEENKATFEHYISLLRSYQEIAKLTPNLLPFWNYVESNNLIKLNPSSIAVAINTFQMDLQAQVKFNQLVIEQRNLEKLLEAAKLAEQNDLKKMEEQIDKLQNDLFEANVLLSEQDTIINLHKSYKDSIVGMNNTHQQLKNSLSNVDTDKEKLVEILRRDHINEIVTKLQLTLSEFEQKVSRIDAQKLAINQIETILVEMLQKEKTLKVLVKELSPTEGLIAKGLNGFINIFIKQMNMFINKVWAYPLELVHDSGTDENVDLDYKFGLRVNNGRIVPDIKMGSGAMREICDLAFRIYAMKWLGLTESILMLDELGASFDKEHRNMVTKLIQDIATISDFSQIFVISHYDEMYGSFKHADISVLCPANVVVPSDRGFNKCLEIN